MIPEGNPNLASHLDQQSTSSPDVDTVPIEPDRWQQEEQLSKVQHLVSELRHWITSAPKWEPFEQARALERRLAPELERFNVRVDSVLVVGVVGGTGVGKSTFINAIVGETVCPAGEMRPTTLNPHIVCEAGLDTRFLGLDKVQPTVHGRSSKLLRHIVLIDCPDPDTQAENDLSNKNLDMLREILPSCDVLIWVATAQKYRSHRVTDELVRHAPGRCIVFVQSHASSDSDIREHWRETLRESGLVVERIFRVDAKEALDDGLANRPIRQYEFAELKHLIEEQLANRARLRIQRSNVVDLCHWIIGEVNKFTTAGAESFEQLKSAIERQHACLLEKVRPRVAMIASHASVQAHQCIPIQILQRWAWGPFTSFLRVLSGLRGLLPWLPFARARSATQLAIAGAIVAADTAMQAWAKLRATAQLWEPGNLGISEGDVSQSRDVIETFAREAGLKPGVLGHGRSNWSTTFLENLAGELNRQVDSFIEHEVSWRVDFRANAFTHLIFEILFALVPAMVLYRLGKNFFYEHLWLGQALMPWDFALYGLLWAVAIGLALRFALVAICEVGLRRAIAEKMSNVGKDAFGGLAADITAELKEREQYMFDLSRLKDNSTKLRSAIRVVEPGVATFQICARPESEPKP
jgi:GTPase SAR1 family protein